MAPINQRLKGFIMALGVILVIGTFGFMKAEELTLGDAIYFSIVTISTVGYGDVHPTTQLGKIIATILIIGGTGSFLGIAATATERLINTRERKMRSAKLNMLIGAFYSDIGTELLTYLSDADPTLPEIKKKLAKKDKWTAKEFTILRKSLNKYNYQIDPNKLDVKDIKKFLQEKRNFLLRLLENPLLLEHEGFSEILRAVFHFSEELKVRKTLENLPETDLDHLKGDLHRIYVLLARQWVEYMLYQKKYYPYLFSLAMRTNPFDEDASPIVKE
jgi:hypothetical protein